MRTESAIDSARPKSIITAGTGRKKRHRMRTMPTANAMSLPPRFAAGAVPTAVNDIADLEHWEPDKLLLPRQDASRTLREDRTAGRPTPFWRAEGLFVPLLDSSVDRLREDRKLSPDERGRETRGDKDRDHLRHKGERHLLYLGQGLHERNDDADRHRRADARPGADHHPPNRGLNEIDRVAFVHCTLAPLASETVAPVVSVATEPELVTLTEATWPEVDPSAEVMV